MEKDIITICFGEILWNVFPDEERINAAPLNVASCMGTPEFKPE
ncbi:hypothetical protein [Autumnicola psychrophila]|uniref:Uncharacterized protein n=1 Tax=Autumnicola psychrophila TaxID=3075592 RepID=A0ABU3DUN9_9FLAO|nr:hypothetical protein [Zunongwangia sp. F225]MDT0687422.1 hypothetical protein [Zunongwangia sp. F225]